MVTGPFLNCMSVLRCPDGSRGRLISSQQAVDRTSPHIQTVDCSSSEQWRDTPTVEASQSVQRSGIPSLLARQSATCTASCTTSCYTNNTQYNSQDCYDLSGWMWARGIRFPLTPCSPLIGHVAGQYPVKPLERVVMTWGSCMYAFTNERQENITWCDSQWVSNRDSMAALS